jgi:pimeloyl-ACP methyl ester carboxylesterase
MPEAGRPLPPLPARVAAALLLWAAVLLGLPAAPAAEPPGPAPAADTDSRFVEEPILGSRVYVREAGRGHPFTVVLVHGLGDDASQVWDGLMPLLAEHYHVVAFDLPGFGRSSKPDALYSPAAYAAFVQWVVDRTVTGRFALVGHSLGGAVALRVAAEHPDRLDRLLLVDVAGVLHRMALTRDLLAPGLADRMPWAPPAPLKALDELIRSAVDRLPDAPVDLGLVLKTPYLRRKILGGDPAKIASLALAEDDFSAVLGQVRVPTLVLWGANDRVASRRTATLLATNLPRARLRILEGAAHEPMREQPELFDTAVLEWLSAEEAADPLPATPDAPGDRVGTCNGRKGLVFTGPYRRIAVTGCIDVHLSGVTAEQIEITGSTVQMDDCRVRGGDEGIVLKDSTLVATGLRVEAGDAIVTSGSRLDLAGVELVGERTAVRAKDASEVLFSVSRVQSPHTRGFLHGMKDVTPQAPL